MSEPKHMNFLRNNWHLLVVFLAVVVAIPIVAMRERAEQQRAEQAASVSADGTPVAVSKPRVAPLAARETTRDAALKTIESHRQKLDSDPGSAEAPALLSAMGNLYRQKLSDYEQAADCFERLLSEYPDSTNVRDAYLQLVICYDRLGDVENRRRILRRMMDVYPPDSEPHLYAAQQLGL